MSDAAERQVSLVLAPDAGVDQAELAALTRRLREELLTADVVAVDVPSLGAAPEGSKGIDVMAWGTLVVSFVNAQALQQVISIVQGWLGRHDGGSITVKDGDSSITIANATADERRRLIDEWVSARSGA
ncbi:MAG TPA: hypothetical protein VFO60_08880 [Candidatus Dormibacteraeota bacterium]|nr:hypothetical protein [Candidatus Dormibacteraeota bacterium]